MLSIGKLAADASVGRYYLEQVASGREDYYANDGEIPGVWIGSGSSALGAVGEVTAEAFTRMLAAQAPQTGAALRRPPNRGAVAGFDLTFRAPKSVSVLFGITGEDVARELQAAHAAAVGDALGYLERNACGGRRGKGGCVAVKGAGFVAAAFEHRASRAGDPLLHTHVVVGNMTHGPDGRWTALDGRLLYAHAKTAGYVYQAVLRAEVTRRLGLEFGPVENGTADIVGVPRGVIEHFSQRRAAIVELMTSRGESSARAAQVATLETRRSKDYSVPVDELRRHWRARAAEQGLTSSRLDALLSRPAEAAHRDDDGRLLDSLTHDQSSFDRRDVIQACAAAAGPEATAAAVEAHAELLLGREDVVLLTAAGPDARFSTTRLIRIESELLDAATVSKDQGAGLASCDGVRAALTAHHVLNEEQRDLVVALTRSGDGVQVVRAAAGTGKTTALQAAERAWRTSGVRVLGCALSARAACELRDGAAIDATTIASLKRGLESGMALPTGSVLIVDEAGMVGTRDIALLAAATGRAGGKLVLVGDDRQLPEIEAGGAFGALADALGATELHEVHRQREDWDRRALADLRDGSVDRFVREYRDHGRLVATASKDDALRAVVEDWFTASGDGGRSLMIAHRRADVAELNAQARRLLQDAGRLRPDELHAAGAGFARGDRVVATRNDRSLGVVNGAAGELLAVGEDHVQVRLDAGSTVRLPFAYLQAGHLGHAYAVTAHRAQGATVDRTFVLGSDELYREWGYTAMSRHRVEARFYVAARAEFVNQPARPLTTDGDVERRVVNVVGSRKAQALASELRRASDPLKALRPRRERESNQRRGVER